MITTSEFNPGSNDRRQEVRPLEPWMLTPEGTDRRQNPEEVLAALEFTYGDDSEWYTSPSAIPGGMKLPESEPQEDDHSNTESVTQAVQEVERVNWWNRNKARVYLGAVAAGVGGTVAGVANGSFEDITESVSEEAPWVIPALIASEGLFVAGAAGMVAGAGKEVGNPFTIRSRYQEVLGAAAHNVAFRAGLAANTLGALGTAGTIAIGAAKALPPETWPGAFGLVAADMASTLAVRAGAYHGMKLAGEKAETKEAKVSIKTRQARLEDIDRLADIDLELFESAYGETKPSKAEVVAMLTRRFMNSGESMFVTELNGEVEGFVSGFRTNISANEFESWETSTNNGTLDGRVAPDGNYFYVTNMTINHNASKAGAKEMLLAQLFAYAIEAGVDYGYFESRIPGLKRWISKQQKAGREINTDDPESMQRVVDEYVNTRHKKVLEDGTIIKGKRIDPMLRIYEGFGYSIDRAVPKAFNDDASMDFGVVCRADIPPSIARFKRIKPVRMAYAAAVRLAAKSPKIIKKII